MRLFGAPSPSFRGTQREEITGEPPRPPKNRGPRIIACALRCRPGRAQREPGPIIRRQSMAHGVLVPAFAGTTIERTEHWHWPRPAAYPRESGIAGTNGSQGDSVCRPNALESNTTDVAKPK